MRNDPDMPGIVSIELSQFEGHKLFDFIEGLIQGIGTESKINALKEAQDKLGDANALALWLRENITLELHHSEAIRLLDMLPAGHEEGDRSQEVQVALASIRGKLITCLPGDLALHA